MRIAGVREIKQKLSGYLDMLHNTPVIVTKHGRPCAALVELTNEMDLEAFLCAHNHRLTAMIDRSASHAQEIRFEDVEKKVLKRAGHKLAARKSGERKQ